MSDLSLRVILAATDKLTGPMKRMTGGSKRTAAALRQAKSELRALNAQGRKLKSLDKQQAQLREFARAAQGAGPPTAKLARKQAALAAKVKASGAALRAAGIDAKAHGTAMLGAEKHVAKLTRRLERQAKFKRFRQGFNSLVGNIRNGAAAIAINAGIIGAPLVAMTRTAAQFERYGAVMESLTGSSAKAKDAMRWVSDFAATTPQQIDGVMQSFIKLKSFGLDPMNGTLQALVDQNAKLGGDQQQLEGIILAVGQAWAKQKLQGEEINQLVERSVPVWDLLAKVTGESGAALAKMASKGELGRDVIKALLAEMGSSSAGAAANQMKTWDGLMSNLGDQWQRFQLLIMQSGAFERLKGNLQDILDRINAMAASGELEALAAKVGKFFTDFIGAAETGVTFARDFAAAVSLITSPIAEVARGFGTLVAIIEIEGTKAIKALVSAFETLPAKFAQIGSAIVDGIKRGFLGKWNALKNWVGAQAKGLLDSAKSALGIKSPSRAFAGIGQNIVRGLQQGIQRNADAPVRQVTALAKRMQQAGAGLALGTGAAIAAAAPLPAPSAAPGSAATGMGGDTINITVNAAGAEARDIAQEIERILEQHSRDKAARLRSALIDID